MRTRVTFLLPGLTITLLAAGVLWWYPPHSPVILSPSPPVEQPIVSAPSPRAGLSTVYLPVRIPVQSIADRLNDQVPWRFSGREDDPVKRSSVIDDQLTWQARRGPIAVRARGGELHLAVPASGEARVVGKVRPVRGTVGRILRRATGGGSDIPFRVRAEAAASLTARLRPVLHEDWQITSIATASVAVAKAEVPIAGIARVSVRSQVRTALQRKVDRQLQRLQRQLASDKRLRRLAEREWTRLHRVERLSEAPDSWLVVRPLRVLATQFRVTADAVEAGLGIEAELRVLVQDNPPVLAQTPLPPLTFTDEQAGRIRIETEAAAPWENLNALLAARVVGRTFEPDEATRFAVRAINAGPSADGLLLRVTFDAERRGWYAASGKLFLTARPRLDVDTQTLHFDNLAYTLETQDAMIGAANWLMEVAILRTLQERAVIDLSRYVARVENRVQRSLDRLVARVPDGVELAARLNGLALTGLRVSQEALLVSAQADADLDAAVTTLAP